MNSDKVIRLTGIVVIALLALYLAYTHLGYFGDISFLGGILLLQVILVCLWSYDSRYFPLLMIVFLWAGMRVPLQSTWTSGRWVVLAAGAVVGFAMWMKTPRRHFGAFHLVALFCVGAALVSASFSQFQQMALLKAVSLLLLFVYGASGARLAVLDREGRFFRGLLLGCEIAVYGTAICYFALGSRIWGNPNSLGAAMSVGVFPILLWGWITSERGMLRWRRLAALLLCTYSTFFSFARAGIGSVLLVTLVFCICLRQYKLLVRVAALFLGLAALAGLLAPEKTTTSAVELKDAVLYKGHKEEGVLGSRRTPWEITVSSIREHPYFGTGYGTSPSGEDPGTSFGRFSSSAETAREHGSSYMTIAEWVGLLGVLPFAALMGLTAFNVWRVCLWMRKTGNPYHFSVPMAMVLFAGFIHASFEDWLFAVGSYECLYFWVFAFCLVDLVPAGEKAGYRVAVPGVSRRPAVRLRTIVTNP